MIIIIMLFDLVTYMFKLIFIFQCSYAKLVMYLKEKLRKGVKERLFLNM